MAAKSSDTKSSPSSAAAWNEGVPDTLRFEEAMAELEGIVQDMAGGDLPLEKLVSSHERAVRLLGHCQRRLDEAKERIKIIDESGGGVVLKPLESEDDPADNEPSFPIEL